MFAWVNAYTHSRSTSTHANMQAHKQLHTHTTSTHKYANTHRHCIPTQICKHTHTHYIHIHKCANTHTQNTLYPNTQELKRTSRQYFCFVFNFFPLILFYNVWISCLHVCAPSVCNACKGQQRVPDPLELALLMVMSCHVGSGN